LTFAAILVLAGFLTSISSQEYCLGENPSFRAYADHMESAEFKEGINQLLTLATERPTTELHPFTSAARIIDGKLSYEGLFAGELESLGTQVYS
jgi:hypothetical protein